MKLSNTELVHHIKGMQQGKKKDFEQIYRAFLPYAYFVVQTTHPDKNEADDIVQEAFIFVYKNIRQLKNPAAFVSWFNKILNGVLTRAYQKKQEPAAEEDAAAGEIPEMKEDFLPESSFERKELRGKVLNEVAQLPYSQRRVIIAYYFQDLKISEISESFLISEGAVKNALYKSRLSLEKRLASTFNATAFTIPLPFILRHEFNSVSVAPEVAASIWKGVSGGVSKTAAAVKLAVVLKTIGIGHAAAVFIAAGAVTAGISVAAPVLSGAPAAVEAVVSEPRTDTLADMLGTADAALLVELCEESAESRDEELNALLLRQNIAPDLYSRTLDGGEQAESFMLIKSDKRLYVIRAKSTGQYQLSYRLGEADAPALTAAELPGPDAE